MPVFRRFKNANYTTMSNFHLRDKRLSLKAKGLQSMLLSLPEKWQFSVRGLAEICREGKAGVTGALRELEAWGYLVRRQARLPDGRLGRVEYWIYEHPQPGPDASCPDSPEPDSPHPDLPEPDSPCPASPCPENPDTALPDAASPPPAEPDPETRPQRKTDLRKTEQTKHERMCTPRPRGRYGNVLLSDEALGALQAEFPHDWQSRVERLSEYMASTGKRYRNHLATLRSWARRETAKPGGWGQEKYQFREGESL